VPAARDGRILCKRRASLSAAPAPPRRPASAFALSKAAAAAAAAAHPLSRRLKMVAPLITGGYAGVLAVGFVGLAFSIIKARAHRWRGCPGGALRPPSQAAHAAAEALPDRCRHR